MSFPRLQPAIIFTVLLTFPAFAADFTGRVVGVSDGDTISVLHNGHGEKVRLYGIDCPEKRQAFGQRAKQFTSELVFGKEVTVRDRGRDKYGRTIGEVVLGDGRVVNRELVMAGMAWAYRKYSTVYVSEEADARAIGRGLWGDPDPVPPWEFRHRMKQAFK